MNKFCKYLIYAAVAVSLTGCGAATLKPNYSSTNPDLMRIGGDSPGMRGPETLNLGSYCLEVTDTWKADGVTPDGENIWSKDTTRKAVPCK